MEELFDKYKNRLENRELPEDGFDKEFLWDAIAGEIQEKTPLVKKKGNSSIYLLGGIALVLIGSLFMFETYKLADKGTYKLADKNKYKETYKLTNKEDSKKASKALGAKSRSARSVDNKSKSSHKIEKELVDIIENKTIQFNKKRSSQSVIQKYKPVPFQNHEIKREENRINTSTNGESSDLRNSNVIPLHTNGEKENLIEGINVLNNSIENDEFLIGKNIASLDIGLLTNKFEEKMKLLDISKYILSKETKLELAYLSSINLPYFQYKSNENKELAERKNTTESGYVSFNKALSAKAIIDNKWTLGLGLELNTINSRFSYTSERTVPEYKENYLVGVVIDANKDTVNLIYADTLIDIKKTRIVRHYNSIKTYSIPLAFGFQKTKSRWTYGLNLGPVLHINRSQSGRALDENSEINYLEDHTSTIIKLTWGLRASVYLGYDLNHKFKLQCKPNFGWHNAKFEGGAYSLDIYQSNVALGLVYKL